MKNVLLSTMFMFGCWSLQAQIPNGSDAPDFTVTDLEGNTHSLSNYLAQGKTVIIDISATWCSPCWNYHNSGALYDLYYVNGQGGSGDVVVLFVEGDGNTPVQSLYGISDVNDTWGDWTKHSAYPIIDSAELAELYEITYFPTIFRICPDGKVKILPQYDFAELQTNINENCQALTSAQNHGKLEITNQKICEGSPIVPEVSLRNFGSTVITNATVELRQGETVLATKNYSGTIGTLATKEFSFDPVEIGEGTDYEAVVTSINGSLPLNQQTASDTFDVTETPEGANNVTVKVYTSYYPAEMSWAIKNSIGTVVGSGGPYEAGTEDDFGGGGADADITKIHNLTFPGSDTECYSVEFYTSTGYGWTAGDTPHGIEIFSGDTAIFSQFVNNFGSVLVVPSAFKTNGTLENPTFETTNFSLFPNPTSGILNFSTKEAVTICIFDMTGKKVYTAENISNNDSINLSSLQKGVYTARINSENFLRTEKLIIN
jgi:hypothetical protein